MVFSLASIVLAQRFIRLVLRKVHQRRVEENPFNCTPQFLRRSVDFYMDIEVARHNRSLDVHPDFIDFTALTSSEDEDDDDEPSGRPSVLPFFYSLHSSAPGTSSQ